MESIYPTDGYVTTQVVITGTNFGDRAEAVKVFFGEAQSNKVLDCKNNRLVVEVPETAVTGNLSLQIYNKKVENIGHYTVLPTPRVITVTSDSEDGEGVADTGKSYFYNFYSCFLMNFYFIQVYSIIIRYFY